MLRPLIFKKWTRIALFNPTSLYYSRYYSPHYSPYYSQGYSQDYSQGMADLSGAPLEGAAPSNYDMGSLPCLAAPIQEDTLLGGQAGYRVCSHLRENLELLPEMVSARGISLSIMPLHLDWLEKITHNASGGRCSVSAS